MGKKPKKDQAPVPQQHTPTSSPKTPSLTPLRRNLLLSSALSPAGTTLLNVIQAEKRPLEDSAEAPAREAKRLKTVKEMKSQKTEGEKAVKEAEKRKRKRQRKKEQEQKEEERRKEEEKEKNWEQKGKAATKTVLASSLTLNWPPFSVSSQNEVVELLSRELKGLSKAIKKESQKRGKKAAETTEQPSQSPNPFVADPEYMSAYKKTFVLGINAVTRALEKKQLKLMIVCKDVQPSILTQHFPLLCCNAGARLIGLPSGSKYLAPIFGLKTLAAVGFKDPLPLFKPLFNALEEFTLPLTSPILEGVKGAPTLQPMRALQLQTKGRSGGPRGREQEKRSSKASKQPPSQQQTQPQPQQPQPSQKQEPQQQQQQKAQPKQPQEQQPKQPQQKQQPKQQSKQHKKA